MVAGRQRVAQVLLGGVAGAGAGHAAPALLRSRPLRARVAPRLAGQGSDGHLALTFDDGPDPAGTPEVLDALAGLGWHATFFMLGTQVARYPHLAREVAAAGHEIAVHGFTHGNHLVRSWRDVRTDLSRATDVIGRATDVAPVWFRPPYGVLTGGSLRAACAGGLQPVLWTAWGRDWEASNGRRVARTVARQLRPGGTVLLHDSDCTARVPRSWQATVAALPRLAELAGELDCSVGTVGEHLLP